MGDAFWEGRAQSDNPNPLQIPLHPQRPVTGRLTFDGTAPAAGLRVMLWTDVTVMNKGGGGGSSWDAPVQFATTDAEGAFRFPDAARGVTPLRFGVALDGADVRARLTSDGLAPPLLAAPFRDNGLRGAWGREENPRELGTASLGAESRVQVRLMDTTGSPVRGVEVFVLPKTGSRGGIAIHNTTDGAGRCLLFAAKAGELLVAVANGRGYVLSEVTGEPTQDVRLVPFSVATGQVLGAGGAAAGGATLLCSGMRTTLRADLTQDQIAIRDIAGEINDHVAKGTCDPEGRFQLPYVPMRAAALRVHVSHGEGEKRQSATVVIESDPDSKPEPAEVRLK
jgi:hypothetical protein